MASEVPAEEKEEYSVRAGWQPVNGIDKLAEALVKAQASHLAAIKDANNPFHKSKYADLASVWEAIRGPLTENGLSVVQFPCEAPTGHVGLLTVLMHVSGQMLAERFYMPVKDPSNPQAVGSALTYARRYALSAAVGVCPEDDDGNAATAQIKGWDKVKSEAASALAYNDFCALPTEGAAKAFYSSFKIGFPEMDPTIKQATLTKMADMIRSGKFES